MTGMTFDVLLSPRQLQCELQRWIYEYDNCELLHSRNDHSNSISHEQVFLDTLTLSSDFSLSIFTKSVEVQNHR